MNRTGWTITADWSGPSEAEDLAFDARYIAGLGNELTCAWDGNTEDVEPVRILTGPGDKVAFARITELCAGCRGAIETGDAVAIISRLTGFMEDESERLDAAAVLVRRYDGVVERRM